MVGTVQAAGLGVATMMIPLALMLLLAVVDGRSPWLLAPAVAAAASGAVIMRRLDRSTNG
jgi:hypothetical protein